MAASRTPAPAPQPAHRTRHPAGDGPRLSVQLTPTARAALDYLHSPQCPNPFSLTATTYALIEARAHALGWRGHALAPPRPRAFSAAVPRRAPQPRYTTSVSMTPEASALRRFVALTCGADHPGGRLCLNRAINVAVVEAAHKAGWRPPRRPA